MWRVWANLKLLLIMFQEILAQQLFLLFLRCSQKIADGDENVNINDSRTGIIKILNKMGGGIKLKNRRNYNGEKVADIHIKSKNKLKSINC